MESEAFPYRVGFIGAGNMAKAIGTRILQSAIVKPENLIVSAPSNRNLQYWAEKGIKTTNDNWDVFKFAHIVFIAVKPQYFDAMVNALIPDSSFHGSMCFVSIMAGKTIKTVRKVLSPVILPDGVEIIKVMPNTPGMVGAGCSIMAIEKPNGRFEMPVKHLIETTGTCEVIPEYLMNACGALSASTPAFLYMVIEALADGAVKSGIPRDLAYNLAAQTMQGAGKMALVSGKHPGVLKDEVCSPGGTTIAGVHELEKAGMRAAFMNALTAAVEKSEQFGQQS